MSETFETAMWTLLAIGAFGVGLFTFLGLMHERAEQAIAAILVVLRDSPKPLRGLQIVEASHGFVSRSSVYVYLGRLQENGIVASRYDETDAYANTPWQRRVYWLTERGRAMAEEP